MWILCPHQYDLYYSYTRRSLRTPCIQSNRQLRISIRNRFRNRVHILQSICCSTESNQGSQGENGNKAGKLFFPNVRYYLIKNSSSSSFPHLPFKDKPTDEILGSTKKILLDHRGVVYAQRSALKAEKEQVAALEKDIHSENPNKASFGILTVDTDLNLTPTSSWLPHSPIASLCTTKKGVVLGVLQSTDDEEYIPVLWMAASTGTCIEDTECFLVGISLIDLKRFQAGIVDQLVDVFSSQFQVKAKNLRVLVGMTPSMNFPRISGKQVLEVFEKWKWTRQFQVVHIVGKRHTEQLVVSKKQNNLQKEVLARKTLGSIQWKVDISRLVAQRLRHLGTVVLNSSFPVSLLDNTYQDKQTEIQKSETRNRNILSAAISIP